MRLKLRTLKLKVQALGLSFLSWAVWPLELISFQIGFSLASLVLHGLYIPLSRLRWALARKRAQVLKDLSQDMRALSLVRTRRIQRERLEYILSNGSTGASRAGSKPDPEPAEAEEVLRGGWPGLR